MKKNNWAGVVGGTVRGIRSRVIPTPFGCVSGRGLWKELWEEYALVSFRHHLGALEGGGCGRNCGGNMLSCHSDTIRVRCLSAGMSTTSTHDFFSTTSYFSFGLYAYVLIALMG
uniref:Uncharacterized protein n=1 Tax=Timema monikensis TaxID=170555 RepID=A0A7R9HN28_9NEOP|nr:unnamed protein product [Timema monikensis]